MAIFFLLRFKIYWFIFPKNTAASAHLRIESFIVWLTTFSPFFFVRFLYKSWAIFAITAKDFCTRACIFCNFRSANLVWSEIVLQISMLTLFGSKPPIFSGGKTLPKRFSTFSGFVLFQIRSWKVLVNFSFRGGPFLSMFSYPMKYHLNKYLKSMCWIRCWNCNNFWQDLPLALLNLYYIKLGNTLDLLNLYLMKHWVIH